MLTSSVILPHPALQPFIQNYIVCNSEDNNVHLSFPLYAHHETSVGFFLGDTAIQVENFETKKVIDIQQKFFLFGLSACCKETMSSKGNYYTFTIQFKPTGFTGIFGIPSVEIRDNIYPANDVIGESITRLYNQLLHAARASEMAECADQFLMSCKNHQKRTNINHNIAEVSSHLITNSKRLKVSDYAYQANMSVRNFERKFKEQVGISPKLFSRLLRFNAALQLKIHRPDMSWADVAFEFEYADKLHLIKEFKQFANESPAFIIDNNPVFVDYKCYKIRDLSKA
jgi:AraC-like DNA-binding protein